MTTKLDTGSLFPRTTLRLVGDISFALAHGVTRAQADALGAWWDDRRDSIQPSEFVIERDGRVLHATYSSSPIGRVEPGDVLSAPRFSDRPAP